MNNGTDYYPDFPNGTLPMEITNPEVTLPPVWSPITVSMTTTEVDNEIEHMFYIPPEETTFEIEKAFKNAKKVIKGPVFFVGDRKKKAQKRLIENMEGKKPTKKRKLKRISIPEKAGFRIKSIRVQVQYEAI
uniref:Uncharacterized protein n=1 Tax=Chromera velia CCMP2878 TaxID=1169474 RepID=A0A0G4FVP3_9ALVE|eukprot:Cvel_18998.t1-p1 / transcript=Cvel_18998.t1 / gene=Cvel_18998 / organism=Chromera_velia_CCMP2878 / gene_product=hypothetical protein / transcript_product=hypothetical protein / location=Cvel_scaffold1608:1516-1908(-) / protein_length=131 / sequence_SO=supercontig / SO=protein_coding / is_pseudo=false